MDGVLSLTGGGTILSRTSCGGGKRLGNRNSTVFATIGLVGGPAVSGFQTILFSFDVSLFILMAHIN